MNSYNASREDLNFTMDQAFEYQDKHLAEWELVLKPEIYEVLHRRVKAKNTPEITSPWDVCRGTSIDQILFDIREELLYPL
jgi:hypothetical protein